MTTPANSDSGTSSAEPQGDRQVEYPGSIPHIAMIRRPIVRASHNDDDLDFQRELPTAINGYANILNDIEREYAAMFAEHVKRHPRRVPTEPCSRAQFLADIAANRDLQLKTIWRMCAYCVNANILFTLLEKAPREKEDELCERAAFKDVRLLRNKLLAHNPYAEPRDDSPADKRASLRLASGSVIASDREGHIVVKRARIVEADQDITKSTVGTFPELVQTCSTVFTSIMKRLGPI